MRLSVSLVLVLVAMVLASEPAIAESAAPMASALPWWAWVLLLFVVTFVLGVLAVMVGVGGGVLFVPIVSGLFPFHLDFVRGTGLLPRSRAPWLPAPPCCAPEWPIFNSRCRPL
jgi:hypothetical protein